MPTPTQPTPHLWVVLTEPDENPLTVVIVNLTTPRWDSDRTVILQPADHTFITHETVVLYAEAVIVPVEPLNKYVDLRPNCRRDDCSTSMIKRVRDGLLASPETPKKVKAYCRLRF